MERGHLVLFFFLLPFPERSRQIFVLSTIRFTLQHNYKETQNKKRTKYNHELTAARYRALRHRPRGGIYPWSP